MTELIYSLKRAQPTTRREHKVQECHICNNSLIVIQSCFQQEQIILEMFARLTLDPEITLRIRMREMRGIRVDDRTAGVTAGVIGWGDGRRGYW